RPRRAHPEDGVAGAEGGGEGLHRLRVAQDLHADRVRRRRRAGRLAAGRRGAGLRRGCPRRALRRTGGAPARQHARGDRPFARQERLHLQCAQVPPTGQPQPRALRGGAVLAAPAAPARADQAQADTRNGALRGADAARHRGEHREPARKAAPLPGRAADRDLSPGVPAAQPPGQGESVGGPVPRGGHDRGLVIWRRASIYAPSPFQGEPMRTLWTAFLILVLASLAGCGYNDIQRADEQVKSAWSEVLNQYQRRNDLVPNLVNTVKGFAAQEQQILLGVTEARAKVGSIQATPELINDPAAFSK